MDGKFNLSKKAISLFLAIIVFITTLPVSDITVNAGTQSATTITGLEINAALKELVAEWDSSQADYIYNESARDAASGVTKIYSSETISEKARQVVDTRPEMQAEAELAEEPAIDQTTEYVTEAVSETETQTEAQTEAQTEIETYSEPETTAEIVTESQTETMTEEYIPVIEDVTNLNDETSVVIETETTEEVQYSADTVDTNIQAIVWSEKAPVDGMNTVNLSEDGSIVAWYEPASVKEQADLYNGIDHINVTDPDGNTIKVYKEYYNTVYIYSYVDYADLYTYFNSDMSHAFENMAALSDISALRHFRSDNTENMSYMFANDYSLTDISPISGFNTSKLTDVSYMFNGASYLTNVREYMSEHTYDSYAEIKQSEANELKDLILEYVSIEDEDSLQIPGLNATYEDSDGSYQVPYTAWSVSFYITYEGALVNTSVEEYPEWVYRNEGLDIPYHVTIADTENGSASLTDAGGNFIYTDKYYKNDIVYFYAGGNDGYEVSEIIIQDENENKIEYSQADEENHICSFTMPESDVIISVKFDIPEPETEETTEETTEEVTEVETESFMEETSETTEEFTDTEETSEIITEAETERLEKFTKSDETKEITEEVTTESVEETAEDVAAEEETTKEPSTEETTSEEITEEETFMEETSEETTIEEESSEEITEEETVTETTEEISEYPDVDITGIDADMSSMRLLIAGTSDILKNDKYVISSYNDTYILQFNTITETKRAYVYYGGLKNIDFVEIDNNVFSVSVNETEADKEALTGSVYETKPSADGTTSIIEH